MRETQSIKIKFKFHLSKAKARTSLILQDRVHPSVNVKRKRSYKEKTPNPLLKNHKIAKMRVIPKFKSQIQRSTQKKIKVLILEKITSLRDQEEKTRVHILLQTVMWVREEKTIKWKKITKTKLFQLLKKIASQVKVSKETFIRSILIKLKNVLQIKVPINKSSMKSRNALLLLSLHNWFVLFDLQTYHFPQEK